MIKKLNCKAAKMWAAAPISYEASTKQVDAALIAGYTKGNVTTCAACTI